MINKNITNKILKMLLFISLAMILLQSKSYAGVSLSQASVELGVNKSKTVTVSSSDGTGNISVSSSDPSVAVASISDNGWIEKNSITITITSKAKGTATISVTGVIADDKANETKVAKTINVSVVEPSQNNTTDTTNTSSSANNMSSNSDATQTTTTKSNNANLKNLGIKPNDFKGFKPGTTTYSVTVPNDVDKVTVYAEKSDAKATISGVGSKKLEVGKNELSVTVTAEDGNKKTYTINVTREEKKADDDSKNNTTTNTVANETPDNKVPENTTATTNKISNVDLVKMEVQGAALTPKFSPDVYEYKVRVDQDVKDLTINTETKNNDIEVEVVGNTDLQDGENTVTVLVTNKKDNKTSTYQIIVEKGAQEEENTIHAMQKGLKIRKILIGLMVAFVVFCIVVFIILKRKTATNTTNSKYEYDDEDEDRINLDDEEEFFNRVNKTKLRRKENLEDVTDKNDESFVEDQYTPKALRPNKPIIEQKEKQDEEDDEDEEVQYFRASRPKKGKHF